jgi:hypothetical protein
MAVLLLSGCLHDQSPTTEEIAFTTVTKGSAIQPRYMGAGEVIITSLGQWKANVGDLVPNINFSNEIVIAAFSGEKPTGGYYINIDSVVKSGGNYMISIERTSPGEGCIVTQALSWPYHIIRMEKVPITNIVIEYKNIVDEC